ncbi:hypothetical protein [Amycolatopsis alba]|uniref:Uncharacterized protein n=1 Tax=Amycolatopsis alba DSM 44262 TaxID=1125972 RepID=A0A229RDH4_AMYAL|nr:hypothetical protein [Amycolatopsis alba]OXM44501.1 hypothetical protein CFP75_34350 [Amycolatopsis alba DSM 44262]
MSPNTSPADPATTTEARSAAEHCAAAEALFTRAREIYPTLSSRAHDQDEYRRCLDWARMHLRLAETITAGASLVLAHRQLRANPDVPLYDTYINAETRPWNEYIKNQHDPAERSA